MTELKQTGPGWANTLRIGMRLSNAGVGPSEWYLYMWLLTLVQARQAGPLLRTNVSMIRHGVDTPIGRLNAPRMALNTIKSAMANLEQAGLLHIDRDDTGHIVWLDIKFL